MSNDATRRRKLLGRCGAALAVAAVVWSVAVLATHVRPPTVRRTLDPAAIHPEVGKAWIVRAPDGLWPWVNLHDIAEAPTRSRMELFEDGVPLGPAHRLHDEVRTDGAGAYSHSIQMLRFSTPDGSDPRSSGRVYTVAWSAAPVPSGVVAAAVVAAACVVLARARWVLRVMDEGARFGARAGRRIARAAPRVAIVVPAAAIIVGALSWTQVWTVGRAVPSQALMSTDPEFERLRADAGRDLDGLRKIHLTNHPMEAYVAPFVELVLPTLGRSPRTIEVEVAGTAVPRVADRTEFVEAARAGRPAFYAMHDGITIDAGERAGGGAIVTLPARVSVGGLVAGVLLLGAAVALARPAPTGSWPAALRRRGSLACVAVGAGLMALNIVGLAMPLRPASIVVGASPPGGGLGPHDVRIDWNDAKVALSRRDGEADLDYAERLTSLVAGTMAHAWIPAEAEALHMQVPPWRSWPLWLLGETRPGWRELRLAEPASALERGVGMCDQVSMTLAALLQDAGIDARVAVLDGHGLVLMHEAGRQTAILDPDYGVTFRFGLDEAGRHAEAIRAAYLDAMRHSEYVGGEPVAAILVRAFAAPPLAIADAWRPDQFNVTTRRQERMIEAMKWLAPAALLALGVIGMRARRGAAIAGA